MTGRIDASILTERDVDDASQVELLLDQIAEPVEVFMGDGGMTEPVCTLPWTSPIRLP